MFDIFFRKSNLKRKSNNDYQMWNYNYNMPNRYIEDKEIKQMFEDIMNRLDRIENLLIEKKKNNE